MRTVEGYWNYCEQIEMVHINQQKLMSLFKRIYGITIYAFVKKQRMEKVMSLLINSDVCKK